MKVLLVQPPHYFNGNSRPPNFFPIGLGYIARSLLEAGHTVDIVDIYAHQYQKEEAIREIKNRDFDVVGISAMSTQYNYVKWLASACKALDKAKPVILGGALATFSSQVVLANLEIDICVLGEGERTIVELLDNLKDLNSIKGICFKKKEEIICTGQRKYIDQLDDIPFPAYELFPMDIYLTNSIIINYANKNKALNIISGRGCPYSCNFCSKVFRGSRFRSVDNIIEEIKYLKKRFNIQGLFFCDELLVVNKKRMSELCYKISPLNLKWNCQGRVNTVDLNLLRQMKAAGCVAIGFGVESGSQKILNNMNKNATVEMAEFAIENTKKAGMLPVIQMMFGYPGEDRETIQETINFFDKNDLPETEFSLTTPLPGSRLYYNSLKDGLIDEKVLLENLDAGYMPGARVLVNYTQFTNEELVALQKNTEKIIQRNYIKKHKFRMIKEYYFRIKLNIAQGTIKRALWKKLLRVLSR